MDDKTLNKMLDSHVPPAPSSNLAARILSVSEQSNASVSKPFMKRYAPLAASLLAISLVGYTLFTPNQNSETETEVWQEAALDLGFDEIYNWVESKDGPAQQY